MTTPNTATPPVAAVQAPRACIFQPDPALTDYAPALSLGQGWPKEINGEPVAHYWKEVLLPRRFTDAAGTEHVVPPERIDGLLTTFRKLAGKGKLPTLPSHHPQPGEPQDALHNLGHVTDARKNDKGGLEVLCRFVGVDAIRASARNAASIGTVTGFVDADGEKYGEAIDHVAIVPDPRITNLEQFQPALAASSGPAVPAVVLTPAAAIDRRDDMPELKELRKALQLADTTPDDQVVLKAVEKLTAAPPAPPKVEDSDAYKALLARAEAADAKAMQLSQSTRTVDPEILNDRLGVFSDKLDGMPITPEQRKAALEIVAPSGQPSPMFLSQSVTTGPAKSVLKLLELQNTNPFGQKTGAQPVPRQVPGGNDSPDLLAEGRTEGANWQKQQQQARNLTSAA